MKIVCIENNCADCQGQPFMLFKPDTALLNGNKPFFIPAFTQQVEARAELVIRISRMGRNIGERFAGRYYEPVGLGVNFRARDLHDLARQDMLPWSVSDGFDGSAAVSDIVPLAQLDADTTALPFRLDVNEQTVQQGQATDLKWGFDRIVAEVSRYFTLRTGDLIFTGSPQEGTTVGIDDHLDGYIGRSRLLNFNIK